MRLRLLLTNAVLLAGLLWLGGDRPGGAAPVPKEKPKEKPRTTAEMIVGKWRDVRLPNGARPDPARNYRTEFTAGGKIICSATGPKGEPDQVVGSYKVAGDLLYIEYEDFPPQHRHWKAIIVAVTDRQLITRALDDRPGEEGWSERIDW